MGSRVCTLVRAWRWNSVGASQRRQARCLQCRLPPSSVASADPLVLEPQSRTNEAISPEIRLSVHPNPVKGIATALLELARPAHVGLTLYDALGRTVLRVSEPEARESGRYSISFDTTRLPPGFYVMRAEASGVQTVVRPLVVIR